MKGILFDNYHTYRTWGLFMKPSSLSLPTVRKRQVTIPGRHGALDLSRALTGEVQFENRALTCNFISLAPRSEWERLKREMLHALHGKEMKIISDEDPNYYFEGIVEITAWKPSNTYVDITISAEVAPYKRERYGEGATL